MDGPTLVKLAHIAFAFALVGGLAGRDLALRQAARTTHLATVRSLVALAGTFERRLLIPASFLVLAAGLVAAWARGIPILGSLTGSGPNWVLVSVVLYAVVMLQVPLVFVPRGRRFDAAMEAASAAAAVTPELTAALRDPVVWRARAIEWLLLAVVLTLMVTRPF